MRDVRKHLTFANVTSFTALFVALGSGAAYATSLVFPANSITALQMAANSVGRSEMKSGSVGAAELRKESVGSKELQKDAVGMENLNPGTRGMLGSVGGQIAALQLSMAEAQKKADAARASAEAAQGDAQSAKATAGGAQATAQAAGAVAYARVNADGSIDAANSKNVIAGTKDVGGAGLYCLKLTGGVTAKNVQVSIDIAGADSRDSVGVTLSPVAVDSQCAATDSAAVGTADWSTNTFANRPFYIVFQ